MKAIENRLIPTHPESMSQFDNFDWFTNPVYEKL
jgi:hypothetical protein